MQSETTDFTLGAATWPTVRNINVLLLFFLIFIFSLFFVSWPCARLSWPSRQLLSARKSTVSYRIVSLSLILACSLHYIKTWCHPQNQRYTTHCVATVGDRDSTTGNMYGKCREIWTCGFWDMRADRQTNTQTHWSLYFASLPGAE